MNSEDNMQPKLTQTTQNDSHWVSNLDIETLSNIIAEQIKQDEATPKTQNTDNNSKFQPPRPIHSQHIRFNLIHHHGVTNNLTTLQLFKSHLTVLHHADSSAIILPFMALKQHYSSLHNLKQIKEIEENRMYQYFKPYYQINK
jgi:hypothetical protein